MKLCRCCQVNPCVPDRTVCIECRREIENARAKMYYRRKLNSRLDKESCNCGSPTCNGLQCERATA